MIVAIVVIILVLFRIMMCTHLPLGCAAPYEAGVLYHPPLFIFSTDAQELFVHALYCVECLRISTHRDRGASFFDLPDFRLAKS